MPPSSADLRPNGPPSWLLPDAAAGCGGLLWRKTGPSPPASWRTQGQVTGQAHFPSLKTSGGSSKPHSSSLKGGIHVPPVHFPPLLGCVTSKADLIALFTYPSILTRAGIPPDLKIANRPSLWWDRLWSVPAVQRAVSTSFVFCMVLTMADTICGERMMAWREASFFES